MIHLEFGEPDFETPPVIREAAEKALKDGRDALRRHARASCRCARPSPSTTATRYGVTVSPDQILVTAGTSPAMLLLFGALLERGDQVILSDPHYACYPKFVKYAEAEPVLRAGGRGRRLPAPARGGRRGLTPRTRAILINSPANPTGTVLGPDRMAALGAPRRPGSCPTRSITA